MLPISSRSSFSLDAVPEKYCTSRVFAWQEKVYSRSEVATAQVGLWGSGRGRGLSPTGGACGGRAAGVKGGRGNGRVQLVNVD